MPLNSPVLTKIGFRPGIVKELTRTAGEGGWFDCDKVRFRYGKPEKIGGWENINGTGDAATYVGMTRALITWTLLNSTPTIGFGTHKKLYLWQGGTYYDITPILITVTATDAITTSVGSNLVLVSVASHGAEPGDYVIISHTSVTVGGNVLLDPTISVGTEYVVQDPVPSTNTFRVQYVSVAAATSAMAGGAFTVAFQLPIGLQSSAAGFGWGVGPWGESTWGTPRSTSLPIALRQWALDNFGEDLVANPRMDTIYKWDATLGPTSRAVEVSAAPAQIITIITSQEARILLALGCTDTTGTFDPLNIRWCAQEDLTQWTPDPTNTSGEFRLSGSNSIIGAARTQQQILVWTDDALYGIIYTGDDFVFSIKPIAQNCGLIGPHAAIVAGGKTYWMSRGNFYVYDGSTNVLPCDVFHYVFDNLDYTQAAKVFAGINSSWNEVIWLYQSLDSTTGEIDRYVIYNYVEKVWYIGSLTRTAWSDAVVFTDPIGAGEDGVLYYQDVGVDADGSAMPSWLESNDFDIGDGDSIMYMDRIVPDYVMEGDLSMEIKVRKFPGDTYQTKGPFPVSASTPKIDMRARGRQALVRVDTSAVGDTWRMGELRFQLAPDGRH